MSNVASGRGVVAALIVAVLVAAGASTRPAPAHAVSSSSQGKVTICHATGSGRYVRITVDSSGLNGHRQHSRDLIPAPSGGCPTRDPGDCEQQGLPCGNIPEVPSGWWLLVALGGGVAAHVCGGRRRRGGGRRG